MSENQANLQEAHGLLTESIRWADAEMFRELAAKLCRARALIADSLSPRQETSICGWGEGPQQN